MATILAVAEARDGKLRGISAEVVSAARTLAEKLSGDVHAVLVGGPGTVAAAGELGTWGATKVHAAEDAALEKYNPEAYAATVAAAVQAGGYHTVLFPASAMGKDLAPRVAAKLDLPLASDATALEVEGSELVITRPVYAGRAFAQVVLKAEPRLVAVRANTFRPQERSAAGEVVALAVPAGDWKVKVREVTAETGGAMDVAEAPIVVAGGRGMKEPGNWTILEELRDALGAQAALGASRAVVDAGWRPHGEQVGQTGKTVSPQLYFAIGISGAMQHLAGMRSSGTIVAINKDADAPIFKVADYGIVGDAHAIVPRLTEEIRKVRG